MSTAHRALLLAVALLVPSAALAQTENALACYRVKDTGARGRASLTVSNAGVAQTCTVKLPAVVGCLQSALGNVTPPGPGGGPAATAAGDFLCYRLKCPKPVPPGVQMTDDLGGQRVVTFHRAHLVCLPAARGAVVGPPGGNATTTTTIPPGPCSFDQDSRTCVGSCGNGGHCSAVASGGACECRTTKCSDADAPSCDGYCDNGEACIYDITGCTCVNIP
jgi:hypothetical protein